MAPMHTGAPAHTWTPARVRWRGENSGTEGDCFHPLHCWCCSTFISATAASVWAGLSHLGFRESRSLPQAAVFPLLWQKFSDDGIIPAHLILLNRILKYSFETGQGLAEGTFNWFGLRAWEDPIYIFEGVVLLLCDWCVLSLCDLWSHHHLWRRGLGLVQCDWSVSNLSTGGCGGL